MRKAVLGLLLVGLSLLAFITSAFVGDAKAQSCVAAPSGLVSWWPGDGNPTDIQNGNDGTLVNGATFATGLVGHPPTRGRR